MAQETVGIPFSSQDKKPLTSLVIEWDYGHIYLDSQKRPLRGLIVRSGSQLTEGEAFYKGLDISFILLVKRPICDGTSK